MQCFTKLSPQGGRSGTPSERAVGSTKPSRMDSLHVYSREASLGRAHLEAFIERRYFKRFGSIIADHYPTLLGLQNTRGDVLAALGVRGAGHEQLFLERYFDDPIERVIAQAVGLGPSRVEILEIGNMASIGRSASARLIAASAMYLEASRCRYAVVTATDELRKMLGSFGFAWHKLAVARADRLPDRGRSWGRYYEQNPEILVGEIRQAPGRLRSHARAIRMEMI
jgi:hypothetical protein